jgi:3-dehydroquinate synthase
VALGILLAARLSERLRMSAASDTSRLQRLLQQLGLPTRVPADMHPQQLLSLMRLDKKNTAGQLRLILWRGIGRAEIVGGVAEADVLAVLQEAVA